MFRKHTTTIRFHARVSMVWEEVAYAAEGHATAPSHATPAPDSGRATPQPDDHTSARPLSSDDQLCIFARNRLPVP